MSDRKDKELEAIELCMDILKDLNHRELSRVLRYLTVKLFDEMEDKKQARLKGTSK